MYRAVDLSSRSPVSAREVHIDTSDILLLLCTYAPVI